MSGKSPPAFRFLRFTTPAADTVWLRDARAFLLATPDGKPALIDGICPHRGGPLSLGSYDCRTQTLRCPWHGRRHPRAHLLARAWPTIRIGADWIVAVPANAGDGICFTGTGIALSPAPDGAPWRDPGNGRSIAP
jgi:hypothetical protein